ncbi:hypothetical protein [Halobacterium litoreum]|uniref:Uncharacterized protein n=1 Tax=Halobacterium litoreum TaxID=2039234 RepID=A0ABD5NB88_9EURY|nr:hypothetical protein [Halobacterium litoreum]UHH14584.1 hypothetical protein LT972_06180 [Halobacterium litoreum]
MTKVSIGFRGWRFDEDEVFDEHGNYRDVDEMSDDTRERFVRIPQLVDQPCDVCYLEVGDADADEVNAPTAVYGEPRGEVLVCDDHEAAFYYWFLEAGGDEYEGSTELQDAFHEWIAAGNREPDWYDGPDHVDTDPEAVPEPAGDEFEAVDVELPEEEQASVNLLDVDEDLQDEDLDFEAEYPTGDE